MKTKLLYIIALALLVCFTACENETPFDTQSEDDDPIILRPYNESGTGSYNRVCANPDEAYYDSVVAIPTAYTTINWYLDDQLVYTGYKINMCFPAGHYKLIMEAVTTKGKRTERWGTLTVKPYPTDPYSSAPAEGRYGAPGKPITLSGANLDLVKEVLLTNNMMFEDDAPLFSTTEVAVDADGNLTFTLPNLAEGIYQLRFKDADGKLYGSEKIQLTGQSLVSGGYDKFVPGQEWVITGCNLLNVASVKVGETVVTDLATTESTITLIAPAVEVGEYTLSIANMDGSAVSFLTEDGFVEQVTTNAMAKILTEISLWEGHEYILWNADRVRVEASTMAEVPVGSTILIYYEELPEGHEGYIENGAPNPYHKMQIITATWGATLIDGFDVTADTPNPYTFTYTESMQTAIQEQFAMSVVGWGLFINKLTYK